MKKANYYAQVGEGWQRWPFLLPIPDFFMGERLTTVAI
jgi:hypothetical protein